MKKQPKGRKQRGNEIFTWTCGGILLPFSFSACHPPVEKIEKADIASRPFEGKTTLAESALFRPVPRQSS
jgi:hypothetical protein